MVKATNRKQYISYGRIGEISMSLICFKCGNYLKNQGAQTLAFKSKKTSRIMGYQRFDVFKCENGCQTKIYAQPGAKFSLREHQEYNPGSVPHVDRELEVSY
jgi:hypothetical protein